jgi:hypothetical protein
MKIAFIITLTITLNSAFEYKTPVGSSPFPYLTAAHDYSCPGIISNPSLIPFVPGLSLSGAVSRPYSEDELVSGSSAVQYSSGTAGVNFLWNHFGTDIYRENIYSINAGYSPFNFFSLGLSGRVYSLTIEAEEISHSENIYDYGISATLRPLKFLDFSFIQENINSLKNNKNIETIYPERSAGILIKPDRGISLAWNITDTSSGIINTFTASVNPLPIFNLTGGYSRETASYNASASLFISNIKVGYNLRYHSYLGYTHTVALTLNTGSLPESISYSKIRNHEKISPVNINNAQYEDIINLPGMNETYAGRIIAYRDEIGPVSAEALSRIGMTSDDLRRFDEHIYGLERDRLSLARNKQKKPKTYKWKKKESREDKAKRLFRQMLAKGIPANRGIEYSRLAAAGEKMKFRSILSNDKKLTEKQKAEVKRICGI